MKKSFYIPFFALLFSAAAAVLRYLQLRHGFEPITGLSIPGNIHAYLFIGASVLFAVLFFILCARVRPERPTFYDEARSRTALFAFRVFAAFLLMVSAVLKVLDYFNTSLVSQVVLALFSFFSGLAMIGVMVLAKNKRDSLERRFFSIVPVFWSAFALIVFFKDSIINPVLYVYIYELFALVCIMLSLYAHAGLIFGKKRPKTAIFLALLTIYFSTVTVVSEWIELITAGRFDLSMTAISAHVVYVAMICYAFTAASEVLRDYFGNPAERLPELKLVDLQGEEEEEAPDSPDDENPEA